MRVRRGALVDWYVEDDESAVLVDGQVLVLSALATRVLQVVGDEGTTLADVATGLVAHFGEPPSGDAATVARRTVDELVRGGVLVVDPSLGPP